MDFLSITHKNSHLFSGETKHKKLTIKLTEENIFKIAAKNDSTMNQKDINSRVEGINYILYIVICI